MLARCSLFRTDYLVAVALLLLGGAQARCDFIPWQIDAGFGSPNFNWWITGIPNAAGNTAGLGLNPLFSPTQSGSARIGLVHVDAGEFSMLDNPPVTDAALAGDYVMSLFLTDKTSQKRAILTFGGHLSLQIVTVHAPSLPDSVQFSMTAA
jgi:hypothetical protein